MIEIGGECYHNAASAARYLGITRFQFYYNVKSRLQRRKFPGCGWWLYKQSDLESLKNQVEVEPVAIAS